MAKYLFEVSYTAQGAKSLLEGGGGKRRAQPSKRPKASAARSSLSTLLSATPMPS